MSNTAINWALTMPIDPTYKFVLMVLANRANEKDGQICHPSYTQLESDTGFNRSTIARAVAFLVEASLIKREGSTNNGSTKYRIQVGAQCTYQPPRRKPQLVAESNRPSSAEQPSVVAESTCGVVAESNSKPNKKPNIPKGTQSTQPAAVVQTDSAFEIFKELFNQDREPARYQATPNDHVQLAKRRKSQGVGTRDSPPRWAEAVRNYLATPQSKHTLADLASRYDVFVLHPLDRYGKPVGGRNVTESREQAKARRVIEAAGEALNFVHGDTGFGFGGGDYDAEGDSLPQAIERPRRLADKAGL